METVTAPWLLRACFAALPADGSAATLEAVADALSRAPETAASLRMAVLLSIAREGLASLAEREQAYEVEGQWARGVPEGFAWSMYYGVASLADAAGRRVIEASTNGQWRAARVGDSTPIASGRADGATDRERLLAAKRAAVREAWQRGLFDEGAPVVRCAITGDTKPAWMSEAQFRIERIRCAIFARLRQTAATASDLVAACSTAKIEPRVTPDEALLVLQSLSATMVAEGEDEVWSVGAQYIAQGTAADAARELRDLRAEVERLRPLADAARSIAESIRDTRRESDNPGDEDVHVEALLALFPETAGARRKDA